MTVLEILEQKIADGYKIFVEQYEDGRTYRLSKQIDETTRTNVAIISAQTSALFVAKYGPDVHAGFTEYFGKRKEHVTGENAILFYNINEQKLN